MLIANMKLYYERKRLILKCKRIKILGIVLEFEKKQM